jgi:predicted HTH transcriptional regulator
VPGATLDDISPERVAWYVTRRTRGGQITPGPLPELLRKLGVLTTAGNITLPTAAGILLFGKEPQRFLPHATLRVARFLGTDMVTFLDQADVTGTIPQMIVEYIENWGSGVPRMKRAMAAYNLPQPVFEEPGPNFTATFSGPGERFMRELEARPAWMAGLNERQIKVIEYLAERGEITNREYRQMFGLGHTATAKDLAGLVESRLVERRGVGRSTVYIFVANRA